MEVTDTSSARSHQERAERFREENERLRRDNDRLTKLYYRPDVEKLLHRLDDSQREVKRLKEHVNRLDAYISHRDYDREILDENTRLREVLEDIERRTEAPEREPWRLTYRQSFIAELNSVAQRGLLVASEASHEEGREHENSDLRRDLSDTESQLTDALRGGETAQANVVGLEREVQAYKDAIAQTRQAYPESVFRSGPPFRTKDAESADWARRVCDSIENTVREIMSDS